MWCSIKRREVCECCGGHAFGCYGSSRLIHCLNHKCFYRFHLDSLEWRIKQSQEQQEEEEEKDW